MYIKGIAAGSGEFRPASLHAPPAMASGNALFNDISIGLFTLPGRLVPDARWSCTRLSQGPATCLNARTANPAPASSPGAVVSTYVAFYPPALFGVLGYAARAAPNASDALYVGRLADLAIAVAMMGIALSVTRGRWAILGVVASLSPMAVFMASTFNPSGIEISAGVAFAAVTMAMLREAPTRLLWWCFLASGVVLAIGRSGGFVWVLVDVAVLVALIGFRACRNLFTVHPGLSRAAVTAVGLASLLTLTWDVVVGHTPRASLHETVHELGPSLPQLFHMTNQFVGLFGWADVNLPLWIVDLALAGYVSLLVFAVVVARWRTRLVILGLLVATFTVALAIDAATQLPFGFGLQARYIMPMTAMLLVLSGTTVGQWWDRRASGLRHHTDVVRSIRPSAAIALPFVLGLVMLQMIGWLWNSHQYAVGVAGTWNFLDHPRWTPPGGWTLWTVSAGVGTLLLMVGIVSLASVTSAERTSVS